MDFTAPPPISLPVLVMNLLLGLGLSLLMALYYTRWGNSLSNRAKFAPNLPFLTLVTLLIITIVKSSLALSLGLVGALSIVRFRTAIKDPEELMFLFFAIAIGLGMGADQRVPTVAAFLIIMLYLIVTRLILSRSKRSLRNNQYLNIDVKSAENSDDAFAKINGVLTENFGDVELRRMEQEADRLHLMYYVNAKEAVEISSAFSQIRDIYPDAALSIVEQNNLLGS